VVRALNTGVEDPGFKTACAWDFLKKLSIHLEGNVYLALFRGGRGESGEKGEWCPPPVIPLLIQVGNFPAQLLAKRQPLLLQNDEAIGWEYLLFSHSVSDT